MVAPVDLSLSWLVISKTCWNLVETCSTSFAHEIKVQCFTLHWNQTEVSFSLDRIEHLRRNPSVYTWMHVCNLSLRAGISALPVICDPGHGKSFHLECGCGRLPVGVCVLLIISFFSKYGINYCCSLSCMKLKVGHIFREITFVCYAGSYKHQERLDCWILYFLALYALETCKNLSLPQSDWSSTSHI